jgi:hypothetical protein
MRRRVPSLILRCVDEITTPTVMHRSDAHFLFLFQKRPPPEPDDNATTYTRGQDSYTTATGSQHTNTETPVFSGGREQIMAELREASNLMADSVTPEAAQFWRKHVVDLQKRLQSLPNNKSGASTSSAMTGCDERNLVSLVQNTCYVPPSASHYTESPDPAHTKRHNPKSTQKNQESATNTLDPELQGMAMIDVVAPANLPEGFTFEAEIDECRFIATVPSGGVRKGETFACYMRDMEMVSDSDIPLRQWRDKLFDCSKHGSTHPMLLNSFFCPLRKYETIGLQFSLFCAMF